MASVSYHIANLLEKMTSNDKDFRFMATNDLMVELQKDSIKLDDDSERKVVKMLLKLLEDKNGEVQNLAVKCLGPLVNKVKEYQVETIVDTLCNNMVSEKEQLRDISSIGLKTVISELSPASTNLVASICKKITGRLSNAIAKFLSTAIFMIDDVRFVPFTDMHFPGRLGKRHAQHHGGDDDMCALQLTYKLSRFVTPTENWQEPPTEDWQDVMFKEGLVTPTENWQEPPTEDWQDVMFKEGYH